jgi:hypothetical protein
VDHAKKGLTHQGPLQKPRVQKVKSTRASHHGFAGITRHSRTRMVLTVSFAISPVTGFIVTVAPEKR